MRNPTVIDPIIVGPDSTGIEKIRNKPPLERRIPEPSFPIKAFWTGGKSASTSFKFPESVRTRTWALSSVTITKSPLVFFKELLANWERAWVFLEATKAFTNWVWVIRWFFSCISWAWKDWKESKVERVWTRFSFKFSSTSLSKADRINPMAETRVTMIIKETENKICRPRFKRALAFL